MNTRSISHQKLSWQITGIALAVGAVALLGAAALIARADTAPTITNTIQNSSNNTITSGAIGTSVHDVTTIASTTASTTPTGTVDFNVYANTTCSGTPTTQSGVSLVNGAATSSNTTIPVGGLSYMVHYSGDASTTAANSACQAITATASNVTLSTALSTTSVLVGSSVYDTATLNNETANATGTVTYTVYNNNLCTTGAQAAGAKTVTNGNVPNSDTMLFNTAGTFYFKALYSGDQNNSNASGSCQALSVLATSTPLTPPATSTPGTINGNVFNDVNGNDVKDGSESGLSGWTIWLHMGTKKDGYNNPIVKTTTTDASGNYSFPNLALGTYFVEEQEPSSWTQTSNDKKVVLGSASAGATVNFANMMKNGTSTGNHHGDGDNDDDNNGTSTDHGNKGNNGNHWGWFKNGKLNFNFSFPWNKKGN